MDEYQYRFRTHDEVYLGLPEKLIGQTIPTYDPEVSFNEGDSMGYFTTSCRLDEESLENVQGLVIMLEGPDLVE
jgi:hypothetical protein